MTSPEPKAAADASVRGSGEYPPWVVPLLDEAGQLVGSGVVVTRQHVLTCNHVAGCAERTPAGARVTVVHTEPDERLDLALLRVEPALGVEPALFLTARTAQRLQLAQVRVCYWHQDAQGLRALTAHPMGLSAHTDGRGLHFVNLPEGLPHGASGGAGLCHTRRGPACFGVVRWGGERRPCSTLTGADAVGRFLAETDFVARWVDAEDGCSGADTTPGQAQPRGRSHRGLRVAGTLAALSLLGAALWGSGSGPAEGEPPLLATPPGMVRISAGVLMAGSSEATARADFLACTRAQGPKARRECGQDFTTSIFAREVRAPRGGVPESVPMGAFFLDRREVTASEFSAFLSRKGPALEVVRDEERLRAWGLPTPVVVSSAGMRIAAVHEGRSPAPDSVAIRVLAGAFEAAHEQRDQPARLVSWYGAEAYCASVGKRLPTGDEWEWATRAQARSRFPWGDQPPSCAAAVFGRRAGQVCAHLPHRPESAIQASDRSPRGLLHLAGNVSEWTATRLGDGLRQVRGGHYADAAVMLVASRRSQAPAQALSPHVGFRCARDAQPSRSLRFADSAP